MQEHQEGKSVLPPYFNKNGEKGMRAEKSQGGLDQNNWQEKKMKSKR